MAGEYALAQQCIEQALASAGTDPGMSVDTMSNALLATLLAHMLQRRSRKDVASLVEFQLEAGSENEFVITRGC